MERRIFLTQSTLFSAGTILSLNGQLNPNFLLNAKNKSDSQLYENFKDPPSAAKPFVRWWWNGDFIEKKEITRQLNLLKDNGIGGVEINPIKFPGTDNLGIKAIPWLSEEWVELVKYTVNEAKKRDMICDLLPGTGWPYGGEFLEEEDQCRILAMAIDKYKLVGPGSVRFSRQELLDRVGDRTDNEYKRELFLVKIVPAYMEKFEGGTDLTNSFEDEILTIDLPYYKDQFLYVIVKITGKQKVTRGAPGGAGPVLNYYDKQSVRKYLNKISSTLNSQLNGLGTAFRAMFSDSLELVGHSWCNDMPEEFKKRRGYSLKPYLQFVLAYSGFGSSGGNTQGSRLEGTALEEVNRARYDFTITKQELFSERFLKTFQEWCNENGVKSRVQAYGGVGYHPLESSMMVDIPENETWLGDHIGLRDHPGYTSINKFVSSGSKLGGKKIVSCEEMTNISLVFFASLEMIKICGDQSNISGVNHSVLHGFNYSPLAAKFPGWIQFGTYFNEHNTWWPFFKYWTSYKARISSLFQMAYARANIAVMHPLADKWSKYGQQFQPAFGWGVRYPWYEYDLWCAIHQNGDTCDYVSEKIIVQSNMQNGVMDFNHCSYHTLILMEVDSIRPDTAKALLIFAEAGGKLIFIKKAPIKSTGLKNYQENDGIVRHTIEKILNNYPERCKIVDAPQKDLLKWYRYIQVSNDMTPSVKMNHTSRDVMQVQYTYNDLEIYFFINSGRSDRHYFQAEFATGDKIPWIWDPETGDRYLYPYNEKRNKLNIELLPAESKLIVFDKKKEGKVRPLRSIDKSSARNLNESWKAVFNHIDGSEKMKNFNQLTDLKDNPEFRKFAGTIAYTTTFDLHSKDAYSYVDLGIVEGISEVTVNGESLGVRWYGKHLYNLKNVLKNGQNLIEIRVTTIIGNYCKSLSEYPVCQKWTKRQSYASAGLIGPVRLYRSDV